jgi:hypothetical protein
MDSTKLDAALHKFADLRGRVDAVAERLERRSDAKEKEEVEWIVKMNRDRSGKGMWTTVRVQAKTMEEALTTAGQRYRGSDYQYAQSARRA